MGISLTIFGVPTFFSVWTLVMFLIFWLFGVLYISKMMPQESSLRVKRAATLAMFFAFFSVTFHEMSHGVVAYILGEKIAGAGTHAVAAYVTTANSPFDMAPWHEFFIVLAGPMFNLLVGAVLAYFVWLYPESLAENTIQCICYINLSLGWLNAFPIPFLDGGKAVDALTRAVTGLETFSTIVYFLVYAAIALPLYVFLRNKRIRNLVNELEDL